MNTKTRAVQAVQFDMALVRRRGRKMVLIGFPKLQPELPKAFHLIALIAGRDWGYGIDVSDPVSYAELVTLKETQGSNIESVELFSVTDGWLSACYMY